MKKTWSDLKKTNSTLTVGVFNILYSIMHRTYRKEVDKEIDLNDTLS